MKFFFSKKKGMMRGFTFIELLIGIAIIIIVSAVGFLDLIKNKNIRDVELGINKIAAIMREVQRKSITQEDGKQWGVRFENVANNRGRIQVFKGSVFFATSVTQEIAVPNNLYFGEPVYPGGIYDFTFSPIEGRNSYNKFITFNTGSILGPVGDIFVNTLGQTTAQIEKNLVAYWHFDETQQEVESNGNILKDVSGNGNNGLLENIYEWKTNSFCKAGNCLSFNKTYINSSNNTGLKGDFTGTFTFWIYPENFNENVFIMGLIGSEGISRSMGISLTNEGKIKVILSDTCSVFSDDLLLNLEKWNFVAITKSKNISNIQNSINIYLNGNQDPVLQFEGEDQFCQPNLVAQNISIGDDPNFIFSLSSFTNGSLDEIKIYSRILSISEIRNYYNQF